MRRSSLRGRRPRSPRPRASLDSALAPEEFHAMRSMGICPPRSLKASMGAADRAVLARTLAPGIYPCSASHETALCVEVRASHGNVVVLPRGEDDLEQLQGAGSEGGDGTGEVQPPHADELLVEHFPHALHVRLEELEPVGERAGVVQAQILHVENG